MVLYYDMGNDENGEEFEFEIGLDDLEYALIKIIAEEKGITEKDAKIEIANSDKTLNEIAEDYENEIKEFFKDCAIDAYKDAKDYNADPWDYYGFGTSDFV